MLLPLQGRRLYYDLTGPEDAPTICVTHSLASDGGSWSEQVPALLAGGFRVLRLDMRGRGGAGGAGDRADALPRIVDRRDDRSGLCAGPWRAPHLGDVVRYAAGEPQG